MYLKSIEMLGFKSFPGKTKVSFEEGISCIVGPNGSGKSNITDALRWVLGEQNARTLRGGKQEDVIFNGSKKRKPLGMAEVTLLLDNSDGALNMPFTEITVTRRTFRGGGGEYLINNQACRLKDIIELFVDTGIGVDGVSLISQGRINELMSAKPEERRAFVEEAAGIVKYRNRKREATRKLAETERHLERVGDIIHELDGRLQPLQEQAAEAELYLRLREEADSAAITLAVRVLTEFEDKLQAQLEALAEQQEQLLAEDTRRIAIGAEREQWKAAVDQLDEEVAALAQEFYALQGQKEKLEAQRAIVQGQMENAESNCQRLRAELQALSTDEQAKQEEAAALQAHVTATADEVAQLKQVIAAGEGGEQNRREAVAYLEEELAKVKEQAFDFANQLAQQRNQLAYQQQLWEKNHASATRLREQQAQLQETMAAAARQIEQAEQQKLEIRDAAEHAKQQLHQQQQQIQQQNARVAELAAAETETRYRAHSLQVRVNMLADMRKSYEGFYPGVRGLLTAKAKGEAALDGIVDVVANLFEVPAQYQTAVETYLGAALQNIVAQNEQAARRAIAYLKQHELGRATFLPLDTIRPRRKGDIAAVQQLKGVCGLASELVGCAPALQPVNDFLLNQVLLVEDMDTASRAAKALGYRLHVVTLEGDMVNPGGSLSGGSRNKKSADLLGKRRQLEAAAAEHAAMQEKLADEVALLEQGRAKLQELNVLSEETTQQLQRCSNRQFELENEAQTMRAQAQALERQERALRQELAGLNDEMILIEEEQQQIQAGMQGAEQREQEFTAAAAAFSAQLAERQAAWESEREDMTRQRVDLAAREQKLVGQQKSLQRIAQEIEDIHWDQEAKADDLHKSEQELQQQQQQAQQAQGQLVDVMEQLMLLETDLNGKRHGLSAETTRLSELEKTEKELAGACEAMREKLHQMELRKTRMEADCANERDKLAEQFALTLEEALRLPQTEGTRSALQQRLQQLKRELSALGTVNLAAIEEYREVRERHQFLNEQREDLRTARKQLDEVIREMDSIMSGRFRHTFSALSTAFDESFRRLFGGGHAALLMTEPDNVLETGVDLSVALPGKKIANYNLLSGGEKALIGIALMFAVLAVKPSPFCVMDEVDAALDEANIDRFTAYLRDLAHQGQFVMISHRQSTMEAADSLWGVTMEEEGVSKLISVRLQGQGIA